MKTTYDVVSILEKFIFCSEKQFKKYTKTLSILNLTVGRV